MNRRDFLHVAAMGTVAVSLARATHAATGATKPNFLLILTDQQRIDAMSCAGHPTVRTPVMDGLAARGVRFGKSYCTYPLCTPSRASLFTSRMPHEVGIDRNNIGLPGDTPGMGGLFRAAGYETAWAGKWHLPAPYPAYARAPAQREIPGFAVLPMEGALLEKERLAEGKGLNYDPAATIAAIRFLEAPREKPFVLVVSLLNPHDICEYPEITGPNPGLARREKMPALPANLGVPEAEPSAIAEVRSRKLGTGALTDWSDDVWRTMGAVYDNLVEAADREIGRVMAALAKAKLDRTTVVVFTSDHGEMLGSHRLIHKTQFYEEAVAVPLVVCPLGHGKAGVDDRHLASGLDILPTMLDYAGIEAPASLRGRSLRPWVEGRDVPWRGYVVAEVGNPASRWGRMLRTARHKYAVYSRGENPEQLFDRETDPGEMKNLAGDPASHAVLDEHRRLLKEWMQETGDPFASAVAAGKA